MNIQDTDALVVVDVQNDFCPDGALGVPEGDAVVPVINGLIPKFAHVVYSRDWHPADHCSFSGAPQFVDKSWPAHCVQDTPGAAYHPGLRIPEGALHIKKATARDKEAYSAFDGTGLGDMLAQQGVKRVFITGLATDYCVKFTALDALRAGFGVVVLADACRGISPEGVAEALREMEAAGATIAESGDLA